MVVHFEARVKWISKVCDAARVESVLTESGHSVDVLGCTALPQAKDTD
jgi:hypothetical protein